MNVPLYSESADPDPVINAFILDILPCVCYRIVILFKGVIELGKRKKKYTNYGIRLTEKDKKDIDMLIDGMMYATRSQVLRSLPGLYLESQKTIEGLKGEITDLSDEVEDLRWFKGCFAGLVSACDQAGNKKAE